MVKKENRQAFGSTDKFRPKALHSVSYFRYPQLIFVRQNNSPDCFASHKPFGVRFSLRLRQIKIGCLVASYFYLVETRRIELRSENSSIGGSPSAVCGRYSLDHKPANKLMESVASLFMVCSKLCTLTFTAK